MTLMTGKRALLELFKQEGIKVMFGNPGTTELPLMDALAVEDDIHYWHSPPTIPCSSKSSASTNRFEAASSATRRSHAAWSVPL